MPNIWTHILFCQNMVDAIPNQPDFLRQTSFLNLGSQGPDPFFYHHFWPWLKSSSVNEIGKLMHTKHCGDVIMDLIVASKDQSDKVKAYVFGFVTHHILDRHTHPYIHYRAGYEGSNHQKLEVRIDTLMLQKYKQMNSWEFPVHQKIDIGSTIDHDVQNILHATIKKHYPEVDQKTPDYIQKAYKDMKLAFKILSDPFGWKNSLLGPFISAYSHRPIKDNVDYLNEHRNAWHHSATNDVSTKSFLDLYNDAVDEGVGIMTDLIRYWSDSDNRHTILSDLIGHISFDTGMPLALGLTNKYSDPIV